MVLGIAFEWLNEIVLCRLVLPQILLCVVFLATFSENFNQIGSIAYFRILKLSSLCFDELVSTLICLTYGKICFKLAGKTFFAHGFVELRCWNFASKWKALETSSLKDNAVYDVVMLTSENKILLTKELFSWNDTQTRRKVRKHETLSKLANLLKTFFLLNNFMYSNRRSFGRT